MHHLSVALIVFACIFCSALLGLYLRTRLPEHHLSDDSIGVVKLAIGLIATMAALVLGLLISSAKSSFDTVNAEVTHEAANVILLDRVLAQYGPETQEIRGLLEQIVTTGLQQDHPRIVAVHYIRSVWPIHSPECDDHYRVASGALSTSGAIFLLLEMNTPLAGLVTVSLSPMREALAVLDQ